MSIAFADLGVPADLGAVLRKRGITSPFPIQAATLPDVLAGRDVSGRAPTGSGKTIAFAIAIAARTRKPVPRRPRALVLAPTRELARQIEQELTPLVAARGGRVVAVYGGTGYEPQCRALRRGVDVVVACPGRLDRPGRAAATSGSTGSRSSSSTKPTAWPTWASSRRCASCSTPRRRNRQTILFSATLDGDSRCAGAPATSTTRCVTRSAEEEPDPTTSTHMFWTSTHAGRADAHASS